jgi:hypothetical protein
MEQSHSDSQTMHGAIPTLPHTSSWRGTELGTGTNLHLSLPVIRALVYQTIYYMVNRRAVIALGYRLDDWGSRVRFPAVAGNVSLHHRVQNGSGAHPASCPMGTRGSFRGGGVKRQGRETDHLPPSSAEVKNACSYKSTPPPNMSSWRGA